MAQTRRVLIERIMSISPMKTFACVFGVIALVGTWGDASIDSLVSKTPAYKEIIKSSDNKDCLRPCKFGLKPRRCHYQFIIEPTLMEDDRVALTVNGQVPGPAIHVCLNDIVVVEVTNKIPGQELGIHWHGIDHRGSPYMDGVPMITQCPITSGTTYKYAFRASEVGTYFYHAHSVYQHADGVQGALVVSQPTPLEPCSDLYDYDHSSEHTLLISAIFPKQFTNNLDDLRGIKASSLKVNQGGDYRIYVSDGYRYRIRLINSIPLECPLLVSVDEHDLTVIASDGHAVKPFAAKQLLLYPGERMDFIVEAKQSAGRYPMRVRGLGNCEPLDLIVPIVYSGHDNYTSVVESKSLVHTEVSDDVSIEVSEHTITAIGQNLRAFADAPADMVVAPNVGPPMYLAIDTNELNFKDTDNDFRYLNDAMPASMFYPSQLTMNQGSARVVQINGKNFRYPPTPLLTRATEVKLGDYCHVGEEGRVAGVECLQIIGVNEKTTVEIIFVNEGFGSNDSYTFHLHGRAMAVLASDGGEGRGSSSSIDEEGVEGVADRGLSVEEVRRLDAAGKIHRNLLDPPSKDTIAVPPRGFVVARAAVGVEPGAWLLECRACGVSSLPAALVLRARGTGTVPRAVASSLPQCGNFKRPDVLLN